MKVLCSNLSSREDLPQLLSQGHMLPWKHLASYEHSASTRAHYLWPVQDFSMGNICVRAPHWDWLILSQRCIPIWSCSYSILLLSPSLFTTVRPASEDFPCVFLLSLLSFVGIIPSKSLTLLIFYQHLLSRGLNGYTYIHSTNQWEKDRQPNFLSGQPEPGQMEALDLQPYHWRVPELHLQELGFDLAFLPSVSWVPGCILHMRNVGYASDSEQWGSKNIVTRFLVQDFFWKITLVFFQNQCRHFLFSMSDTDSYKGTLKTLKSF